MEARYVAHGLDLRCDFPLAGLSPAADDDLPNVTLQLATPGRLAGRWSGACAAPVWRGRLGDGCELIIARGRAGDMLFTYGERARFHLDASRHLLTCAPRAAGLHWQRALLTKVLADVSLVHGSEALHASAVDSPRGAIAIVAPSGVGKTTLALELMRRGHALLTDDVLTLREGAEGLVAHPATPHMNLAAEHYAAATPLVDTLGRLGHERWVAARSVAARPRPVHGICLLERRMGLARGVSTVSSGPLALAPYMLGLDDDPQRERARFALYADLASSATLLRVSCDSAVSPADVAGLIERALDGEMRPAAVGSAA
jgi:hypothetical protein